MSPARQFQTKRHSTQRTQVSKRADLNFRAVGKIFSFILDESNVAGSAIPDETPFNATHTSKQTSRFKFSGGWKNFFVHFRCRRPDGVAGELDSRARFGVANNAPRDLGHRDHHRANDRRLFLRLPASCVGATARPYGESRGGRAARAAWYVALSHGLRLFYFDLI